MLLTVTTEAGRPSGRNPSEAGKRVGQHHHVGIVQPEAGMPNPGYVHCPSPRRRLSSFQAAGTAKAAMYSLIMSPMMKG